MPGIAYDDPCDRLYGPGNPDYEHDGRSLEMKRGIHRMSMAEYLADPCESPSMSAGIAHTLLTKSPLHAKYEHPKLSPNYQPDSAQHFDIGTAAHGLILEGDDKVCVIEADDWRTKAAKEQREQARANGLTPLLAKHYSTVKAMVAVARDFMASCEIAISLRSAEPELTVLWREGGHWMRARPDLMSADRSIIVNYKTCESAEPSAFARRMPAMGYDLSAAFYERGMAAVNGFPCEEFFIAQETMPPHSCSLIGMDPAMREIAQIKLSEALALWENCMRTGTWRAYPLHVCYASPTSWQMSEAEERKLRVEEQS